MGNAPSCSTFNFEHADVTVSCQCQIEENDPLSVSNLLSQLDKLEITFETPRPQIAIYYHEIILPFLSHPQSIPLLPFFLFRRLPSFFLKDYDSACTNQLDLSLFEKKCLHSFISDCYHLKKFAVSHAKRVRKGTKKRTEEFHKLLEKFQAPSFAKQLVNSWRSSRMENYYMRIAVFCQVIVELVFPDEVFLLREFKDQWLTRYPHLWSILCSCDRDFFTRQVTDCIVKFFDRDGVSTDKESIVLNDCSFFLVLSSLSEFYMENTKFLKKSRYCIFLFTQSHHNLHFSNSLCHYCLSFPIPVAHIHPSCRGNRTLASRAICLACCKFLSVNSISVCPFGCNTEISFSKVLSSTEFNVKSRELEFWVNDVPSYLLFFRRFCFQTFLDFTRRFITRDSPLRNVLTQFREKVKYEVLPPYRFTKFARTRHKRAAALNFADGLEVMIGILNSHQALSHEDSRSLSVFHKRLLSSSILKPQLWISGSCTYSLSSFRVQNLLLHLFDEMCVFNRSLSLQKTIFPYFVDLLHQCSQELVIDSYALPLLSSSLFVGTFRLHFKEVQLTHEDLGFIQGHFHKLFACLKEWKEFEPKIGSKRLKFFGIACDDGNLSPNFEIEQAIERFGLTRVVQECLNKVCFAPISLFKCCPLRLYCKILKLCEIPHESFPESLINSIKTIFFVDSGRSNQVFLVT
ncbi:hypothetical protein P9112_010069 [Eukaryota sp. TZLM1-RC]